MGTFAGRQWSSDALTALWVYEGGPSDVSRLAAEIALSESGGHEEAVSDTGCVGLWQICPPPPDADEPHANARYAIGKYEGAGDFSDWTQFNPTAAALVAEWEEDPAAFNRKYGNNNGEDPEGPEIGMGPCSGWVVREPYAFDYTPGAHASAPIEWTATVSDERVYGPEPVYGPIYLRDDVVHFADYYEAVVDVSIAGSCELAIPRQGCPNDAVLINPLFQLEPGVPFRFTSPHTDAPTAGIERFTMLVDDQVVVDRYHEGEDPGFAPNWWGAGLPTTPELPTHSDYRYILAFGCPPWPVKNGINHSPYGDFSYDSGGFVVVLAFEDYFWDLDDGETHTVQFEWEITNLRKWSERRPLDPPIPPKYTYYDGPGGTVYFQPWPAQYEEYDVTAGVEGAPGRELDEGGPGPTVETFGMKKLYGTREGPGNIQGEPAPVGSLKHPRPVVGDGGRQIVDALS